MYVKVTNGSVDQFPYTVAQLRRDNPNVSFPKRVPQAALEAYGVFSVSVSDAPSCDERTQKVSRNAAPVLSGGSWSIGWSVEAKSAEEVQQYDNALAAANRKKRDGLIAATDYHALSDVTMSAEMTSYRQALRDITNHANWPNLSDDDWPTKP